MDNLLTIAGMVSTTSFTVVKKPEEAARMEGSPGSVNEVVDTIPAMVSKLSINE
jgi:hypothetical protein